MYAHDAATHLTPRRIITYYTTTFPLRHGNTLVVPENNITRRSETNARNVAYISGDTHITASNFMLSKNTLSATNILRRTIAFYLL